MRLGSPDLESKKPEKKLREIRLGGIHDKTEILWKTFRKAECTHIVYIYIDHRDLTYPPTSP